jgi:7-cyano-7-deazaguanine tRNA-ribosyltransferase
MFEVLHRDGLARVGQLTTPHGRVRIPALLPVINPKLTTIPPADIRSIFGFDALITNSYIIRNKEELRESALSKDVHDLLGFGGTVMTDSGTFQSHMYGEVEVTNREMVGFQRDIGSDIGTVLDIFTEPYWNHEETSRAVDVTMERTSEAADMKDRMLLAGVVQGSIFTDLRESCALRMRDMNVDVHPIGGVVPLMESYRFADLVEVIMASKKGLNPSRPVHLFGAGHPMVFALAALLGCDMFDSASYAKYARDGRLMFPEGTSHLGTMKELTCMCPACRGHTLESIRAMDERERFDLLARHNLWACKLEMDRVRQAIKEGDLWELVERRCRVHPYLLDGLRRLRHHNDILERYEPLSREGAIFYTGIESVHRPAFSRCSRRIMERFPFGGRRMIRLSEIMKPFGRHCSRTIMDRWNGETDIVVRSTIGPVPIQLDEAYPVAQSLFPDQWDPVLESHVDRMMKSIGAGYEEILDVEPEGTGEPPDLEELDQARVMGVIDYQFGKGSSDAIVDGRLDIAKSRTTGKIRTVSVDGEHALSIRASDGLFTLRPPGARRLLGASTSPRWRVIVEDDAVPFNREGKNVFCKFVVDCDDSLVPMDEVMVVDQRDDLVAIGRIILTRDEMMAFDKGVAVKVREGIKE